MKKNTEYRSENSEWKFSYSKFCILYSVLFFLLMRFPLHAQKNKPYYEDLSKLRPRIELPTESLVVKEKPDKIKPPVIPMKTVNAKVDFVLDSIDRFNLTRKFIDGFTIQIYSGQKRDDAMDIKKKMQEEVFDLQANLRYEQPKFKVTVGRYFTRLEAQHDLLLLKSKFATASLVPEKIMLK